MEYQIFHRLTVTQVVVDDAVHILGRNVVVPRPVRLHAHDRSALAGGKTADAATLDAQFAFVQSGGFELVAQAVKQCLRGAVLTAARTGADQDVTVIVADFRLDDGLAHASLSSLAAASASTGSARVSRM